MAALFTSLLTTLEWKEIIPVGTGLPSKATLPETVPRPPPQPHNKKADKSSRVPMPRRSFAKDPYISHNLLFPAILRGPVHGESRAFSDRENMLWWVGACR